MSERNHATDADELARHVDDITRQGFTVIPDVLVGDDLAEARRVLALYLDTHRGRNDFEGRHAIKALAVDYENRVVSQASRAGARLPEG